MYHMVVVFLDDLHDEIKVHKNVVDEELYHQYLMSGWKWRWYVIIFMISRT